ncbi:MAG: DUF427 domain-containing protein [Alphaproteobacteria bacterium]
MSAQPQTAGPGPGYARAPEHTITLEREGKRVSVVFNGETIAESTNAITLREANYPPMYYLPRDDVRADVLTRTDHSTHCPFKGDAAYWSIKVGDKDSENAVWSYEIPFDEVVEIKDHMAFYPDRMDAVDVAEV